MGLIRPCLEYCSHVWGGSPFTRFLDRVETKAIRLIEDARLTSSLDSLSRRRIVASLSMFYRIFPSVIVLMNLGPSFLLPFLDPVVLVRHPLLTIFV